MGKSVDVHPEGAVGTVSPHGIVDALLMRTPENPIGPHDAFDVMARNEGGDVSLGGFGAANIIDVGHPRPRRSRGRVIGPLEYGHDELCCTGVVRAVDGDCRKRKVVGSSPTRAPRHLQTVM